MWRVEKGGGTFRVPGELIFRTREEAEHHLREALAGDNKGEGCDKGAKEGGGGCTGDTGGDKGGAGNKDAPKQNPTTQEG